jgi:adenine-specific DNA-methyltransferase
VVRIGSVPDDSFHPSAKNVQLENGEIEIWPIDQEGVERRWNFGLDSIERNLGRVVVLEKNGELDLFVSHEEVVPKTVWYGGEFDAGNYGNTLLVNILGEKRFDFPKSIKLVERCIKLSAEGVDRAIVLDYFGGSGTSGHAVINMSRDGEAGRKYVLFEMGKHFDTVVKPRIQKVVYSASWKDGVPCERESGISHVFKYLRLESYEDALGNLKIQRSEKQLPLVSQSGSARQSYLMHYMLEVETRGSQSLLNTDQFLEPTQYQLNVRSASGDETKTINVDLLESFNYLLGLRVEHIAAPLHFDAEIQQGEHGRWVASVKRNTEGRWWFRTVYGTNPNGEKVVVVWRNLPSVIAGSEKGLEHDNAVLDAVLLEKLKIRLTESQDDEVDILYVNGDHNISIPRDRKGQPLEQARVQLIEEAFHSLMFADTETVH